MVTVIGYVIFLIFAAVLGIIVGIQIERHRIDKHIQKIDSIMRLYDPSLEALFPEYRSITKEDLDSLKNMRRNKNYG